jgi:MFS family permease
MRLLLSVASLLISVVLVQLGSGTLAPLDALSGLAEGFSKTEIGVLGSAHYVGFFAGCWAAPRMMGTIGHVRTFAACSVAGAIGALAHPLWVDPAAWAVMRGLTGFAVAGAYTVIESWLNARVTNETRGKLLGVYRVIDLVASLAAQMLIAVLEPASYISYNIVAILCCLCLVPMILSMAPEPTVPEAPRLRPMAAIRLSPLGAAGVTIAGVTMPAFRMVGPVYGAEIGLDQRGVALFLGAAVLGGALVQVPVGWLADRFDRRAVLIAISAAATCVSLGIVLLRPEGAAAFLAAFVFGLAAFPLYSLSAAHANDFAVPEFITELNAALLFLFAAGAVVSPWLAAALIERFGPPALFGLIAVAHVVLILFGIWRLSRPRAEARAAFRTIPRTSFLAGRLFGRR